MTGNKPNRLHIFKHHVTSGRVTQKTTEVDVSTSASRDYGSKQWERIIIHVKDREANIAYWVNMDRETAARVAQSITKYLERNMDAYSPGSALRHATGCTSHR